MNVRFHLLMKTRLMGPVLGALSLAACAGDLDHEIAAAEHALDASEIVVPTSVWSLAQPGCEDEDFSRVRLVRVEGEPLLGALVKDDAVICVDSLSLLSAELDTGLAVDPLAADPSPQPSHPISQTFAASTHMPSDGSREDPTPTPVTNPDRPDPTPTPVTRPMQRDELRPRVASPDPTPTPITED